MSKKFLFLMSFVLVASLGINAWAEDLAVPYWRGAPDSTYARWDFEVDAVNDAWPATEYIGDSENHISPESLWAEEGTAGDELAAIATWDMPRYASHEGRSGVIETVGGEYPQVIGVINNYPRDPNRLKRVRIQATFYGVTEVFPEMETACAGWGGEGWNWWPGEDEDNFWGLWMLEEYGDANFVFTDLGGGWTHAMMEVDTRTGGDEDFTLNPGAEVFFVSAESKFYIDQVIIDTVCYEGEQPPPGRVTASNISPADDEDHVRPDANLSFQAPWNALCLDPNADPNLKGPFEYDVYFGTDPCFLGLIVDACEPTNCNDVMVFDPCAGNLAYGTVYYWRVDVNDLDPFDPNFYEGPYFSFRTLGFADDESPTDGAVGVKPSVILSWVEDDYAVSRDIYFGTDEAAVEDANTANTATYPGVYRGSTAPVDPCDPNRNTYDPPEILDLLTNYFWRIDEINVVTIKGDVWGFETAAYFVVEDMEPYLNDAALKAVWTTGHLTGNGADLFLEIGDADRIHGGDKSMKFTYMNWAKSGPVYFGSEAVADIASLQSGSDWTRGGAKALVLYFQGDPINGTDHESGYVYPITEDQMYVAVEDGSANVGIVKLPDMNDIKEASWQEWNIDLADPCLADVNIADVAKVYIGFGGQKTGQSVAGAGEKSAKADTVWFDDIQLHPPRCVPAYSLLFGDFVGPGAEEPEEPDCIIDYWDVLLTSNDWLETDYEVPPVEPNRDNLVVEYLFDTDFGDTSGNNRDGVPSVAFTPTVSSGVMSVELGGYVDVGGDFSSVNPFDGSEDFSIFMTYKTSSAGVIISNSDPVAPNDPNLHAMALFLVSDDSGAAYYRAAVYDNFWVGENRVEVEDIDGPTWDAQWHHVAVTYDADGGTCPDEPDDPNLCPPGSTTGLVTVYLDGEPTEEPSNFDPNIPGIADDVVSIGRTLNEDFPAEEIETSFYDGDINDVRIYDIALTHAEVLWLGGERMMIYFPNTSPANMVPKDPCDSADPNLGSGAFDPNNVDIVNFRDYAAMANNWLREIRWPPQP